MSDSADGLLHASRTSLTVMPSWLTPRRRCRHLMDGTKEDVLGADEAMVQEACLFLSQDEYPSGTVGKALEHGNKVATTAVQLEAEPPKAAPPPPPAAAPVGRAFESRPRPSTRYGSRRVLFVEQKGQHDDHRRRVVQGIQYPNAIETWKVKVEAMTSTESCSSTCSPLKPSMASMTS